MQQVGHHQKYRKCHITVYNSLAEVNVHTCFHFHYIEKKNLYHYWEPGNTIQSRQTANYASLTIVFKVFACTVL